MTTQLDLRPDREMEHLVDRWLSDTDLSAHESERGLDRFLDAFPVTPQAPRRSLGRWLDRHEGVKPRPDGTGHPAGPRGRRDRMMFSLTGLTAGLALLLIAASIGVIPAIGPTETLVEASVHIVATDHAGEFTSIQAAVDAAANGDTIRILPGTYTESVVIEKDLIVQGEGERGEIVLVAPEDGPTAPVRRSEFGPDDAYALLLSEADGEVSNLTFRGARSQLHISGGSPTVTGLDFEGVGRIYTGGSAADGNSVVINAGSTAEFSGNTIRTGGPIGVFDYSEPLIEGNTLIDGPHMWGGFGDGAVIRGNTIQGTVVRGIGVFDRSSLTIEDNTIIDPGPTGIELWTGVAPRIIGNRVSGATDSGISVIAQEPTVAWNELAGNWIAIAWNGNDGTIEANSVTGGRAGIVVALGSPLVRGNLVEGVEARGLTISGQGTAPTVRDNKLCGNGEDLYVADGAVPDVDASNEVCDEGIVVAPDGTGDFTSIQAAVDAAVVGDTVLVRPGTYREALVVDKDIRLLGDGDREDILIEWAVASGGRPDGLRISAASPTVAGLSFDGRSPGPTIHVTGGKPVLEDLAVGMATDPGGRSAGSEAITITARAEPTIQGCAWSGYLALRGGSSVTLEGNTISRAMVSLDGPGRSTVTGNTFLKGASISLSHGAIGIVEGNEFDGGSIGIDTRSDITVRDNELRDVGPGAGEAAIFVRDAGTRATIVSNLVSGSPTGIAVARHASATVRGNLLNGNGTPILVRGKTSVVESNRVRGRLISAPARPRRP